MEVWGVLAVFYVLILLWVLYRLSTRAKKRKEYGNILLKFRDVTFIQELMWGLIFLVPFVRFLYDLATKRPETMEFVSGITITDENIRYYSITMASIVLVGYSIIKFMNGLSKVELLEKGILTKNSDFAWEQVEDYIVKDEKKMTVFKFKIVKKNTSFQVISVLKEDTDPVKKVVEKGIKKKAHRG